MSQEGLATRLIDSTDAFMAFIGNALSTPLTAIDYGIDYVTLTVNRVTDGLASTANELLIPLFEQAASWRLPAILGISTLLGLILLILTHRFLARLRRQVRQRKDLESPGTRLPLKQALGRWVFEWVYNILETLWLPLEAHPELWDRTRIRSNTRSLVDKMTQALPFSPRSIAKGNLRNDLLSLMDEGRGEPPQNIPEDLIAALDSHREDKITLSDEWRSTLSTVLDRHKAGNYANLVIRGSSGSGKSMLINWLEQHAGASIMRLSPQSREEAKGMAQMASDPAGWPQGGMLILDNSEYFFERAPGGYSLLETILAGSEQACETALVLSCGNSFYRFLASIFPLDDLFPFNINLDEPGAAQLAKVYGRKLRAAGYQYSVIPDKQTFKRLMTLKRRHAIAERDVPDWLKERFFENLSARGGSGYHFVTYYFMRAIRSVKDRNIRLRIRAPELFDLSFIQQWPTETLFVLQALYLHRSADSESLARTLALPEARVRIDLVRARERSLVLEEEGQYSINPLVDRVVWDILRRKNLFLPE